jgi:hypothetical protein
MKSSCDSTVPPKDVSLPLTQEIAKNANSASLNVQTSHDSPLHHDPDTVDESSMSNTPVDHCSTMSVFEIDFPKDPRYMVKKLSTGDYLKCEDGELLVVIPPETTTLGPTEMGIMSKPCVRTRCGLLDEWCEGNISCKDMWYHFRMHHKEVYQLEMYF